MVLAAAEGGDLVARDVLERIGRALGESAGLVARRLNLSNLPVEVVLAGGLFRTPNRYLLDELELGVRRTAPRAELRPLACPPVVGRRAPRDGTGAHPDHRERRDAAAGGRQRPLLGPADVSDVRVWLVPHTLDRCTDYSTGEPGATRRPRFIHVNSIR